MCVKFIKTVGHSGKGREQVGFLPAPFLPRSFRTSETQSGLEYAVTDNCFDMQSLCL